MKKFGLFIAGVVTGVASVLLCMKIVDWSDKYHCKKREENGWLDDDDDDWFGIYDVDLDDDDDEYTALRNSVCNNNNNSEVGNK